MGRQRGHETNFPDAFPFYQGKENAAWKGWRNMSLWSCPNAGAQKPLTNLVRFLTLIALAIFLQYLQYLICLVYFLRASYIYYMFEFVTYVN